MPDEQPKTKLVQPVVVFADYRGSGFYVFFDASRKPTFADGPHQKLRTAVFVAMGQDGLIPRFESPGFPEGVSNTFAEHVAACSSQYDSTCRALATQLVIARMQIEALQMKLESLDVVNARA